MTLGPFGTTSFFRPPGPAWLTLKTSKCFLSPAHLNIAVYWCSKRTRANWSPLILAVHACSSLWPDRQILAPGFDDALRLLSSDVHITRSPRLVFGWTSKKDSEDFHRFEILLLEAAFSPLPISLARIPKLQVSQLSSGFNAIFLGRKLLNGSAFLAFKLLYQPTGMTRTGEKLL